MCARHAKFSLFLVHSVKRKWKTVNQTATTVYYIENQERLTFCKIICCLAFTYVRHKKFMTERVILQHTTPAPYGMAVWNNFTLHRILRKYNFWIGYSDWGKPFDFSFYYCFIHTLFNFNLFSIAPTVCKRWIYANASCCGSIKYTTNNIEVFIGLLCLHNGS